MISTLVVFTLFAQTQVVGVDLSQEMQNLTIRAGNHRYTLKYASGWELEQQSDQSTACLVAADSGTTLELLAVRIGDEKVSEYVADWEKLAREKPTRCRRLVRSRAFRDVFEVRLMPKFTGDRLLVCSFHFYTKDTDLTVSVLSSRDVGIIELVRIEEMLRQMQVAKGDLEY